MSDLAIENPSGPTDASQAEHLAIVIPFPLDRLRSTTVAEARRRHPSARAR